MELLPAMSVLRFTLSNAHFCLSYEKVNYCKIQNGIIKKICYYLIKNIF